MIDAPLMPNVLALAVCSALFAQGWPGPVEPWQADIGHAASVCRFEQACEVRPPTELDAAKLIDAKRLFDDSDFEPTGLDLAAVGSDRTVIARAGRIVEIVDHG